MIRRRCAAHNWLVNVKRSIKFRLIMDFEPYDALWKTNPTSLLTE